jgi:hypothetical protein
MARSARFAIAWTLLGIVGAGVVAADVMTVTRDASAGVVCSSTRRRSIRSRRRSAF